MAEDHQAVLHRYLRMQRESLLYKLDGLSERDARTPMTPTGTNADLWATPAQTIGWLQGFAERVWAHADQTVAELELDSPGNVPWWGERGSVTLQQILVHLIAEYARHAGHVDVVRELIDGQVGARAHDPNLPSTDPQWWADYRRRLRATAERFPPS